MRFDIELKGTGLNLEKDSTLKKTSISMESNIWWFRADDVPFPLGRFQVPVVLGPGVYNMLDHSKMHFLSATCLKLKQELNCLGKKGKQFTSMLGWWCRKKHNSNHPKWIDGENKPTKIVKSFEPIWFYNDHPFGSKKPLQFYLHSF